MSIATMAMPGKIPVCGKNIKPEDLFRNENERDEYRRLLEYGNAGLQNNLKIKKVSVRIFDLSDEKQLKEYESLWAELLVKTARMEVLVESRKDLVNRADGTSYWMKYVEYVEFCGDQECEKDESRSGKAETNDKR